MSGEIVKNVLLAAAALIEPPGAWTQGEDAVDDYGCSVHPKSASALRWCAFGAIVCVAPSARTRRAALGVLRHAVSGDDGVTGWNDAVGRTQAEVVATLRAAAAGCLP